MKVYKFGGASVNSADGVCNLLNIVRSEQEPLFIIVSAMGKTTNALEKVAGYFVEGKTIQSLKAIDESIRFHKLICTPLFGEKCFPDKVECFWEELRTLVKTCDHKTGDYDLWYDRIVSYGELISTTIISEYFRTQGRDNCWIDMRNVFITDDRHRDANIDLEASSSMMEKTIASCGKNNCVFIGQGFIGGTHTGEPTTLGREGSDYSAAVAAYLLDAKSVTIWKDVDGVLNADPKFFDNTVRIPELTYLDAIELAYSGAQIIHPKTIKPLQNKGIPLYVRPFGDTTKPGSVIHQQIKGKIESPILILKHNQVLVSIRPHDFSFVLEDRFASIFSLLEQHRIKINLIQSSAVNLSLCVDDSRRLIPLEDVLRGYGYRVVYNEGMELLTVRGYTKNLQREYTETEGVYLTQRTRRILRIVRKK